MSTIGQAKERIREVHARYRGFNRLWAAVEREIKASYERGRGGESESASAGEKPEASLLSRGLRLRGAQGPVTVPARSSSTSAEPGRSQGDESLPATPRPPASRWTDEELWVAVRQILDGTIATERGIFLVLRSIRDLR